MAGERTLPGVGLRAYWTPGSNGWNVTHDPDFRKVSALLMPTVKSFVASLPGSPTAGDMHVVTSGAEVNKIAAYDFTAPGVPGWIYLEPGKGWEVYDRATNTKMIYTGTVWVPVLPPTAGGISLSTVTTAHTLTNGDLVGNKIIRVNIATANDFTIPSGLTGLQPVTVVQAGAGKLTFLATGGVTLNSADGKRACRVQFSSATLIPTGTDTFLLIGDIAT